MDGENCGFGPRARAWLLAGLLAAFLIAAPLDQASAEDAGVVFELVEVVADPPNDMWPTVEDGHISGGDPYNNPPIYSTEHTWTGPPKRIGPEGASITLSVAATGRVTAGTGISAIGFELDQADAVAWVHGQADNESNSITVKVTPSAGIGSAAEIKIGAAYAGGVTYRYQAVAGTDGGSGEGGDGGDGGDDEANRVLSARLDCPDTITISALPSLNCHILISGWRRNTADPVEVLFPAAIDTFGNHTNGIQIPQGPGEEDVFDWVEPEYSWGFFVFACPSQQGTGANCYDSVTVPGVPALVPIIVRQRGHGEVSLTLTLNPVARGGPVPLSGQVRFGNRLRAGDFIHIESGKLLSGPIKADWLSAIWSITTVEGTDFVRLCNVWKPEICLNTERQTIEAGPIRLEWWSAMWIIEKSEDPRYIRIQNRWMTGQYLHTERGTLEVGAIKADWPSAQWWVLE